MSPRKVGKLAEAMSAAQDEAEGYACDLKPYGQFSSKDLLAFNAKNGFDRVCVKPNCLTRWTQSKSINKVSQEVLRDMIQWSSDFTVDNIPSALVFLDVWHWEELEGQKVMKMERWDLPKMMGELAHREFAAKVALEKKLAREKAVIDKMVEDVIPESTPVAMGVNSEERELNSVQDVVDSVSKSAEEAKATAEKNMLIKEISIEKLPVNLGVIEKPEGNVETFVMGFTPKDDKEKVKEKIQEGVDVMIVNSEMKEGS